MSCKHFGDILGLHVLLKSLPDFLINFLFSTEVSNKNRITAYHIVCSYHISPLHTTSAVYTYCNCSPSYKKSSYLSQHELSWIRE